MDVSIIIVNYNTAGMIQKCIDSLLRQQDVNYELIVVENASQDDSLNILKQYGDQINLIANEENIGYGKGNNLGFQYSKGKYIYLLNPDTEMLTEYDIKNFLEFMETHKEYGLVSSRMINHDGTKDVTPPHDDYPGEKYIKNRFTGLPGDYAWIFGASMILRREVYETINGFDKDYFVYGEDADFCLRARRAGYSIGYCKDVVIKHLRGGSEQYSTNYELWQRREKGIQLFYKKTYNKADCNKIVRYTLIKAGVDMSLVKMRQIITRKEKYKDRYMKYRAIYDTSKEFLRGKP